MSALAQRTYQHYFDTNEWSNDPADEFLRSENSQMEEYESSIDEFGHSVFEYVSEGDKEIIEHIGVDMATLSSFLVTPVALHHPPKNLIGTYLIAAKKSWQRLTAPIFPHAQSMEVRFAVLSDLWRKDTEFSSSAADIVEHSAYLEIVSWGEQAIPLILRDLEMNGGHWFQALQELTKINPVSPSDAGRVRKMREAWIKWGRDHMLV